MMRFEPKGDGTAAILDAPDKIANTGAFVRRNGRSKGTGAALLDAALRDYAAQGFTRCSVDFESFNPDARGVLAQVFRAGAVVGCAGAGAVTIDVGAHLCVRQCGADTQVCPYSPPTPQP